MKSTKQEQSTLNEGDKQHATIVDRQRSGGGKTFIQFLKKDTTVK